MIIDVKKLKTAGKEESDFSFTYNADDALVTLPGAKFNSPVKVAGTVTLGGNGVTVYGNIEYGLTGQCSRCLESANFQNVVPFDEFYTEDKNEKDCYYYSSGKIDLTEMVKDSLILSMPYGILCVEDCKGLCPGCGVNLNNSECKCIK